MDSHFAPAERATQAELAASAAYAENDPILTALLRSSGICLAVLNEQRQILALNETFLRAIGIEDPELVFGLRPGEALECVHAHDAPGGCGTGSYCATCGAAIAIVASLTEDQPTERRCAATVRRDGQLTDLYFRVTCTPLTLGRRKLLLLMMQDTTDTQRWAELERIFQHDINNILTTLLFNAELMAMETVGPASSDAERVYRLAQRLAGELSLHRRLAVADTAEYALQLEEVDIGQIAAELAELFASHPQAHDKRLQVCLKEPLPPLKTDLHLLRRVVANMLMNAFEATEEGGVVRLTVDGKRGAVEFAVWNAAAIPPESALRVFTRHYSTKGGVGRGLGTFAMRLMGERFLGGRVAFTSSETEGTTFTLRLPVAEEGEA